VLDGEAHIVALVVGDEHAAMQLCQEAIERGVFAQAIRPPAVPPGTARLRLTAMASHTDSELCTAAHALGDAARAIGLDPARFAASLAESAPAIAEPEVELPMIPEAELPHLVFDHERVAGPTDEVPASAESELPRLVFDYERDSSTVRAA
jgi:hypothetical protein